MPISSPFPIPAIAASGPTVLQDSGERRRVLVFLDIDGVLHPADREQSVARRIDEIVAGSLDPRPLGLFCPERQAMLRDILDARPHVDLVLSSAWRTFGEGRTDWLLSLLHPEISSRVIGSTPVLAPQGIFAMPAGWRRREIRAFIAALSDRARYADGWVALDDNTGHFIDHDDPEEPFFYLETTRENHFHRYITLVPACRRDEVVVIFAGARGITPRNAAMIGAAIDHAGGAPAGSAGDSRHLPPQLDVALLAEAVRAQMLHRGRTVARIPDSEWQDTREALVRVVGSGAVASVMLDAGRSPGISPQELLGYAVREQTGAQDCPSTAAALAGSVCRFAVAKGMRRIVFVIEGLEQLSAAGRHAVAVHVREVAEALRGQMMCTVLVLEKQGESSGPESPQLGKCSLFDCEAFEFPDPHRLPYYHDRWPLTADR